VWVPAADVKEMRVSGSNRTGEPDRNSPRREDWSAIAVK